jgi:peptide/nickel transport system permease protein
MRGSGRYAAKRLALAVLTLLGLSLAVFALGTFGTDPSAIIAARDLPPGVDPTEAQIVAVHHRLGLDRPILDRYWEWLGKALHGNLGQSILTGQGVGAALRKAFPATASLAALAMVMVVVLAVPFAVAGALLFGRWFQQVIRLLALAGTSIPGFFLAYLLIYLLAVRLQVFPVIGRGDVRGDILPALTLAIGPAARISRLLQTSLVEQLGEEYVRTARAKGLPEDVVLLSHALRNALLPAFTVAGSVLAGLLEGAVVVELIFSRSGVGALALTAVGSGDYPMIQGVVLLAGVVIVTMNLLVDLAYPVLDPRVRLGARP